MPSYYSESDWVTVLLLGKMIVGLCTYQLHAPGTPPPPGDLPGDPQGTPSQEVVEI